MSNEWNSKALSRFAKAVAVVLLLKILLIHQVEYLHDLHFDPNFSLFIELWKQQRFATPDI